MSLTPEEITLYTTRLTQAEEALHKLKTGQSARVFVDQNGERVEFAAARADQLRAYVLELRTMLGKPTNVTGPLNAWML
tara:strand:- start:21701 stop:21937 length:237 start_codon:yes stop_codon:yes gene_type:complete